MEIKYYYFFIIMNDIYHELYHIKSYFKLSTSHITQIIVINLYRLYLTLFNKLLTNTFSFQIFDCILPIRENLFIVNFLKYLQTNIIKLHSFNNLFFKCLYNFNFSSIDESDIRAFLVISTI